ncbi:MAG: hypothetical protein WCG27_05520 [Pseudomonadota bacterium]
MNKFIFLFLFCSTFAVAGEVAAPKCTLTGKFLVTADYNLGFNQWNLTFNKGKLISLVADDSKGGAPYEFEKKDCRTTKKLNFIRLECSTQASDANQLWGIFLSYQGCQEGETKPQLFVLSAYESALDLTSQSEPKDKAKTYFRIVKHSIKLIE